MAIFYSADENGFYNDILKDSYDEEGSWPNDAKEISDELYEYLMGKQSEGFIIIADKKGNPSVITPPKDWQFTAESQRGQLLTEAKTVTEDWRTDLLLGIIDDSDKQSFILWSSYIKELKLMDLSRVEDEESFLSVEWPVKPA